YYRYYQPGDENGFMHGLKFRVGPEAYARMLGAGIAPETATDDQLAAYADYYFEYDGQQRVVLERVKGGAYTYAFDYSAGPGADDYNQWAAKTVETLPD